MGLHPRMYPRTPQMGVFCSPEHLQTSGGDMRWWIRGGSGVHLGSGGDIGDLVDPEEIWGWIRGGRRVMT